MTLICRIVFRRFLVSNNAMKMQLVSESVTDLKKIIGRLCMKRMKGRLLTALMSLAMVFTMMPMMGTAVYADDPATTPTAINIGSDVLRVGTNTPVAATVHMAGTKWRVIGYGGAGVASSTNTMTLISNGNLATGVKFSDNMDASDANHYSKSNLIGEVNTILDNFAVKERAGIVARTLESGEYHHNPLPDCIAGDPVPSALLWPLSTKEADAMNNSLRMVDHLHQQDLANYWWLRSPGLSKNASIVYGNGEVHIVGIPVTNERGVRPAFNYNLKTVLLTSAATGGKVSGEVGADALTEVGTNENDEWKLTVNDMSRQSFKVTSPVRMLCDDDEVKIKYSEATTEENEYISAIVKRWDGKIKYYGRIANATRSSGTIKLNIGGKIIEDDKLYIFNEQVNGDQKTDLSSPLREVKVRRIHDLHKTEEVEATCTEDGVEAYWTCDICNKLYEDERGETEIYSPVTIPAKGHTEVIDEAVPATCTESGLTEGKHCSVCKTVLEEQETIPAKGHSWDGGKVTKKATPTAEGVKTYTCTGCGEKKTESIPKCAKYANPLKIKAKVAKIKYKKLKKKAQKLAVTKVIKFTKKGQGTMTYKLVSAKKGTKSFKKYIKINAKTGKVTVKKNKKMKKGTYKVKVKAKAAGNATYKASSWKKVTFKIRVK